MSKLNTQQIQAVIESEKLKCFEDPIYMLRKYGKIEHPIKGKIPFHLYEFQQDTINQFNEHRFNIVGKARQMGISTLCAGFVVYKMLTQDAFKVLIIATKQTVAQELINKIKVMYQNLPSWLKKHALVVNDNSTLLNLTNGSSAEAVSSSPNAARSKALSLLIIDEAAFVESFEQIWTSSQSTLATGGSAIILSTPNGANGLFYRLWTQAIAGEAPEGLEKFNPIKLKWDLHPERDKKWRDQQAYILGSEKAAAQENDVEFETSGDTVIEGENLKWYSENSVRDPIEMRGANGEYWLWTYPDYSKNYIVAVDVARGDSSDNSAIQVLDVESCEQVAEWKGKIDPQALGHIAVSIATEWNTALLAIENANVGWTTVQACIDLRYENLYYTYRQDPYMDPNKHIMKNYDLKDKEDMVPGHVTSPKTRPVMIGKLQIATSLQQRYLIYHSSRLHSELQTFRWINGKAQASSGYTDDLVMAICIALYIIETAYRLRKYGIEMNKATLTKITRVMYKPGRVSRDYIMKVNGKDQSLKWLL